MSEVAMCTRVTCVKSETCLRHEDSGTQSIGENQWWFEPKEVDDACAYYWEVEDGSATSQEYLAELDKPVKG